MASFLTRRACLALLLVSTLFLSLSCGGDAGGPRSTGEDTTDAAEPAAKAESEPAEEGPHPAEKALVDLVAFGEKTSATRKRESLGLAYRSHLLNTILTRRDELVALGGASGEEDLARLIREKLKERMKNGKGGPIEIVIGDEMKKMENKRAEEASKARFGQTCEDLKGLTDGEAVDAWLSMNWNEVRPDLESRFLASIRDMLDRVYLFYEGGKGKRLAVAMLIEGGVFRYAGSPAEMDAYLRGPERAMLYDLKTTKQKVEAADLILSQLQSGLLDFKRNLERWPTKIEGLERLLKPVPGAEEQMWMGPYAKHIHDPWGNRYRLAIPGEHNPTFYDVWSAGPDGVDGTSDDIKNW
ncbi:MAG: type II secretion system protein GspG [Planctomycetota bacterium]|jgi:hypothetical protein